MATSDHGQPRPDDRTRAVRDLSCDLAVTAGAGAGKTTVLVDRFVHIVREAGLGPDRVLAITFTRKAAAEMKERVIRLLGSDGQVELRRAAEAAYISTIHGFAERVLREHPFRARIDPAFSVLTDYERELFVEDSLQTMYAREDLRRLAPRLGVQRGAGWRVFALVREVARLLREGPAAARTELDALGRSDDDCVGAALARARGHVDAIDRQAVEQLRVAVPALSGATFKSRGKMWEQAQAYLGAARACLAADGIGDCLATLDETRFTGQIVEQEREAIKAPVQAVKAIARLMAAVDWAAEEARERELLPVRRAIYEAAAAIQGRYADHKRRRGALDFHDLQLRAAELLAGDADVRGEYGDRFRHILLDEAQDTDALQYAIIQSLRTGANALFMVGDPKQAIYEFRGADPDVFHVAIDRLAAEQRLQLAENFRSRPEVISFVNGLGHALLGDRFVHIDARADYGGKWLDAPAIAAIWAVQANLAGDEQRPRWEPVGEARSREAAAVAEEIVRLLREKPLVRDPDAREPSWVPLSPRHIALLFRTRTPIPYFEHALAERGVPYVTAAGQGFYERAEVLDCLTMLRAIAQPLDDLAMAAVLRSPFVGASDADLWRLRSPETDRRDDDPPRALWSALRNDEPLTDFRARFVALRRRVRGASASEALEDAIRTFGYEAALAAHEDGPAMLANLAKLRRQVRDLGAMSPLEAHAELERTRELMSIEPVAPLVGPADDVVVLTTIHQAKGLEWPVVCLPNLQAKRPGQRPGFSARHGVLLCDAVDENGEAVARLSLAPITEELSRREEAEERRLLYVALTRARERLVLSASVKGDAVAPKASGPFTTPLAFLLAHTAGTLAEPGEHDCGSFRTLVRQVVAPVAERTQYEGGATLAASFAPVVVEALPPDEPLPPAAPLSLKVTELLSYRRCPQVYRFAHVLEVEENLPRRAAVRGEEETRVSPVELGTIVHALLERARFDAPDLDAEVARLVAEEPAARRTGLAAMLRAVLEGELGAAVRAAGRIEREWPFATEIGGVLVEGVIDLAIQDADGRWTIVDYKSNDFSRTGRLKHLIEYYGPQLELYALALTKAGMGTVHECALVFLTGPRVHRWRFDPERAGIEAWARDTVARIAARDWGTRVGPKCDLCGYRKRKVCDVGRDWRPGGLGGRSTAPASGT